MHASLHLFAAGVSIACASATVAAAPPATLRVPAEREPQAGSAGWF